MVDDVVSAKAVALLVVERQGFVTCYVIVVTAIQCRWAAEVDWQ